jgi:hypothetical protein
MPQFKEVAGGYAVLVYAGYEKIPGKGGRAIVKKLGELQGRGWPTIPPVLEDALAAHDEERGTQEFKAVRDFCTVKADESERFTTQAAFDTLTYTLERATKHLEREGSDLRGFSEEVWEQLDRLNKNLRKRGIKRPAKAAKPAPADARQEALPV